MNQREIDCRFPKCDHMAGFCVWEPLRSLVGHEGCDQFMFMHRSGEIFSYKHRATRDYWNLDAIGRFYRWTGSGDTYALIAHVVKLEVGGLEETGPMLTFRQSCSCGVTLSEWTIDVSEGPGAMPSGRGGNDAALARQHIESAGGGLAVSLAPGAIALHRIGVVR